MANFYNYRTPNDKGVCLILADNGEFLKVRDVDTRAILWLRSEWVYR
jgi:hypothetical protein